MLYLQTVTVNRN